MTRESKTPTPEDFLPLKPVDLMVLLTLADKELHGYGIVAEIHERTEGRMRLVPGNLYAVLQRLQAQGLLDEADRRPVSEGDDQRRRYYAMTPLGRRVVSAEAERLRGLVGMAEAMELISCRVVEVRSRCSEAHAHAGPHLPGAAPPVSHTHS